jgi:hypothetical protein
MFKYINQEAGFALWLPTGWHRTDMKKGHLGAIFSPYPNDINTSFAAEARKLKYAVKSEDLPVLIEGFEQGLKALPGVEIESTTYTPTSTLVTLEARYTFLEGDSRRKRWVRNIYWGNGQLVFIAQGSTEEEFEYWLPMFFNTMMTFEL